jgi:hypothetical protein
MKQRFLAMDPRNPWFYVSAFVPPGGQSLAAKTAAMMDACYGPGGMQGAQCAELSREVGALRAAKACALGRKTPTPSPSLAAVGSAPTPAQLNAQILSAVSALGTTAPSSLALCGAGY